MPNDSNNVSAGKPKIGGAIFWAPVGTELPTNATAKLNEAFKGIGYASEDGLTNSISRESEDFKAWGGDTVLSSQTSHSDTYKCKFIETLNKDVLTAVFGEGNVTGDLTNGIVVKVNSSEQEERAWVVDTVMRGDIPKRMVIPKGKISELGDIVYKDNEIVGYDTTIKAFPDAEGNTHYEYIGGASATNLSAPKGNAVAVAPVTDQEEDQENIDG